MHEVFDYICAHMKLVYCVSVDCNDWDLFLWCVLCPVPVWCKDWWQCNLVCVYVCMYVCIYAVVLVFFPWCKAAGVCHSPVTNAPLLCLCVMYGMTFHYGACLLNHSVCFKNLLCERSWSGKKRGYRFREKLSSKSKIWNKCEFSLREQVKRLHD